jgi:hypothetical protein
MLASAMKEAIMLVRSATTHLALLVALTLPTAALAQHQHPPEHADLHNQFYQKLKRPDVPPNLPAWQKSCCSDRDCRPTEARYKDGRWEFLRRGQWTPVPPEKIVDDHPPDMQAHVCISVTTDDLLCFVKPDVGI